MSTKGKLRNRVMKAAAAMKFAKIMQRDGYGKIKTCVLPGTMGKLYYVILRRTDGILSTELMLQSSSQLMHPKFCSSVITYHSLAAVMMAAEESGFRVSWCVSEKDARNLARLGGTAFYFYNHLNPSLKMWGVYRNGN